MPMERHCKGVPILLKVAVVVAVHIINYGVTSDIRHAVNELCTSVSEQQRIQMSLYSAMGHGKGRRGGTQYYSRRGRC